MLARYALWIIIFTLCLPYSSSRFNKTTIRLQQQHKVKELIQRSKHLGVTPHRENITEPIYIRLGYSESSLVFVHVLEYRLKLPIDRQLRAYQLHILNWFFSNSGYYDKTITGEYMHYSVKNALTSTIYIRLMNMLATIAHEGVCELHPHQHIQKYNPRYTKAFWNYFEGRSVVKIQKSHFYNFIRDKRLLIVSSFSKLMAQQIHSGNPRKIDSNFPAVISVIPYTSPYTFFNNKYDTLGHSNFFDTLNRMMEDISKINASEFDVVIVSAGAYSAPLASSIRSRVRKPAMTIGGELQTLTGIANLRTRNEFKAKNVSLDERYWITKIPDEYKPKDYQLIEGGCYW